MPGRLLLIVVFVPLLELLLLIEVTRLTSLPVTIGLVVLTGVTGMSLVRWQGLNVWREIKRQLAAGNSPSRQIAHGALIILAGAFLITPGLLTDTVGFSLLIPGIRDWIARQLQTRIWNSATASVRSHVWVSGMEINASGHGNANDRPEANDGPTANAGQMPQVRVVDPGTDRLPE